MKHLALGIVATSLLLTGCENRAGTGALLGAGIGAGAGALIASNPLTGALIGGAAGAVGGAVIGAAMDYSDRCCCQRCCPDTLAKIDNNQQLSTGDVKQLAAAGLKDDVIIGQIQNTRSSYRLSNAQISDLKQSGVSPKVIDYMIRG